MIGKASARTVPGFRRWIHSVWGTTDIHLRQKWMIIWPLLDQFPREGISILDVGCGPGAWSLEIAARRPDWNVVGIDLDGTALREGERNAKALGIRNVEFVQSDYLEYQCAERFDCVLSISSVHYAFECGHGPEMFELFHRWLKPQSRLILYAPRRGTENPFTCWKRGRRWYNDFGAEQLNELCAGHGFIPEHLSPRIGPVGTLAKELQRNPSPVMRAIYYPFSLAFTHMDHGLASSIHRHSLYWLMIARKPRVAQRFIKTPPDIRFRERQRETAISEN